MLRQTRRVGKPDRSRSIELLPFAGAQVEIFARAVYLGLSVFKKIFRREKYNAKASNYSNKAFEHHLKVHLMPNSCSLPRFQSTILFLFIIIHAKINRIIQMKYKRCAVESF